MKNYDVRLTQKAMEDMIEIVRYISHELLQPSTANSVINNIEEAILKLETMPLKYPIVSTKYLSVLGIRKQLIDNYIVFYTVAEEDNNVFIIRVLYQKRNWINLF